MAGRTVAISIFKASVASEVHRSGKSSIMADFNADRGMKRKKKPPGLAPAATAPKLSSQPDGQNSVGTGSNGVSESLEIGSQFRLDLRNEDLLVLKELGHGNGGTVSKVQHVVTKNIMAKKVRGRASSCITYHTVTNICVSRS